MLPVTILAYQRPNEVLKIIDKSITNKIFISLDFPNVFSTFAKNKIKINTGNTGSLKLMYRNYYEIKNLVKNAQEQNKNKEKEIIFLEYGNKNLGIYDHAFAMFDHIFKTEEAVIVFDDDIIPSEAFFYYVNKLYKKGLPITGFSESYSSDFNGSFVKCISNQVWGLVINKSFYLGLKEFCNYIADDGNFSKALKDFLNNSDKADIERYNKRDSDWIASGRKFKDMDLYINMYCVINNIRFLKPTVSLVSPSDNYYKFYSHSYIEVTNYSKQIYIL